MKNLSDLRNEIDQIDDAILKLLVDRMDVVDQVGNLKRANNSLIYHPDREKEIIDIQLPEQFFQSIKFYSLSWNLNRLNDLLNDFFAADAFHFAFRSNNHPVLQNRNSSFFDVFRRYKITAAKGCISFSRI